MYYNTPDPNDLRHPDPTEEEMTNASLPWSDRDDTSDAQANFSSAITAYSDVEEATESDWLEFGSPGTPTDNWDEIPF